MSTYADIRYILNLPAKTGIRLYAKALEQRHDKRSWDIFINSNHEKPISFEDWKKQQLKQHKDSLNKVVNTIVVDDDRIQQIINKDRSNRKE